MKQPALIWTRARADWASDQILLGDFAPVEIVRLPCIETSSLPMTDSVSRQVAAAAGGAVWDYAVFTSQQAVAFGLAIPIVAQAIAQVKMAFTFGKSTHAQLEAAGIRATLVPEARTGEELCAWLKRNLPRGARVMNPTAEVPAFDLAGELSRAGFVAEAVACYRTEARATQVDGSALSLTEVEALKQQLSGVICFASPSAVAGFVSVFAPRGNRLAGALKVAAIGPTTAAAARQHFETLAVAATNDLPALVALARTLF